MKFLKPPLYGNDIQIKTSEHTSTYDQNNGPTTLRKPSTVFGDTGWYNCSDESDKIVRINSNNINTSGMYVYVKPNKNAFVSTPNSFIQHTVRIGNQAILPCRPTAPKFNVTLKTLDGLEPQMVISKRTSFDPKFGFIIHQSKLTDSGNYTCEKKSVTTINGLEHIVVGSTLNISCTVEIEKNNPYNISWETPRDSIPKKVYNYVEENESHVDLVTSNLILNSITYDDGGNYSCQVKSLLSNDDSNYIFLRIYDPEGTYLNLTYEKGKTFFTGVYGHPATIVAHIDAYPPPTLKWFSSRVSVIRSDGNFLIVNTKSLSRLTIKEATWFNYGICTLQATNSAGTKFLKFEFSAPLPGEILTVILADVHGLRSFYPKNKNATFKCSSYGHPKANISWFFK
ncbi:vascular endothelial growth factor receptor 1-like [Copidosoma floridanum]|nr:vascular endothelial growth factor receptor 1-like [Copidosoma floridanum]